jgi:hypothetical protein
MRHTALSSLLLRCLLAVTIAGLLTAGSVAATAKSPDDLDIITVSTRPDTVSGGDVLVRINVPPGVAINDLVIVLTVKLSRVPSSLKLAATLC